MKDPSEIVSFEALYGSMQECRRGVMWKDSVASYRLNAIERTLSLSGELRSGRYRSKSPYRFMVTSPKPREIASIPFRDRVYQRSLNDNAVYPAMSRSFIHANFACQKNKGTDKARDYLAKMLRRHFRKHGADGWVLQCDISGYYPRMPHAVAEETFRRKLTPEVFAMVQEILHAQYKGDEGYNPGSQLVQIAGISVLDGMDHFIKERLHARSYVRYMDDFLIVHHDRKFADECLGRIASFLGGLGFKLNPRKTMVYALSEGIDFLGFTFRLTGTGYVVRTVRSKNVRAQRRKLRRLVAKSMRGGIPKDKVCESYAAWRSHASKGNSFKLTQRMDRFFRDLWKAGGIGDGADKEGQHGSGAGQGSGKRLGRQGQA